MRMGNILRAAGRAAIVFILASGCAKERDIPSNGDAKFFFDSWIQLNCPGIEPYGSGIYIMDDDEGTGEAVADSQFVYLSYVATDLEGTITDYTEESTARMLGEYDETSGRYYGPRIWTRASGFMYGGVNEMLTGMRQGGTRKAVIPGWLMSNTWYGSEQEYLDNAGGTNSIYTVTVVDPIQNITQWQIDSIGRFLAGGYRSHDFGYLDLGIYIEKNGITSAKDSSDMYGFYFIEIEHGQELNNDDSSDSGDGGDTSDGYDWEDSHFFTTSDSNDTTIYINYVGRLLNGKVFDTNIKRVADDNNLSGGDYTPMAIQWADSYSELIMGTSDSTPNMITGFAMTLWRMHPFGKAIGIFYSNYGYGYSGSGNTIPAYSPLMFEIEVVENPDDND